jgi:anti-sigma-K factor RskA
VNIQEYISTGILESYVLGLATNKEKLEVESLARQHPEIATELRAIEDALEKYSLNKAIAPPLTVKEALWAHIQTGPKRIALPTKTIQEAPPASGTSADNMIRLKPWLVSAALILIVASLGINALLYPRWQKTEEQWMALLSEKKLLAAQIQINNAPFKSSDQQFTWLQHPGLQVIALKPTGMDPHAQATVYWQPATEELFLAVHHLPAPPPGKQYQLWVIRDGKPVDAGILALQASSKQMLHSMKSTPQAQAFAITLEQAGGSSSPTLDAMYVIGNV